MTTATLERDSVQTMEIRKEIEIASSVELAFEALLEELGPEAQMPDGKSLALKLEPWPGGRWFRDLGKNAGHLWGHVQVIKPPSLLEICGPMAMSYAAINHIQYRLKPEGKGTRLTLHHRAMGQIPPEQRDGMDEGWQQWLNAIRDLAQHKANASSRPGR